MRRLLLVTILLTVGALSAPAVAAFAQTEAVAAKGLGIRLAEAPANRANDPRALIYVIDHVAPGAVIERKIEVSNTTGQATKARIYGGAATVTAGAFTPSEQGEVASWISTSASEVELRDGEARIIDAKITVPAKATAGERYGVVWAELPGLTGADGITQVNRVGVRIYLSVGPGGEPKSAFVIEDLTASRNNDGAPIISARVRNTGGRALDMTGELKLENGPGGLTAGPFPAKLGTTLGVGQSAPVTVTLDERIPAGPWEARITLRSGTEERSAKAMVTFPDQAGESAAPVEATEIERQKRVLLPVAGVLLLLTGGALLAFLLRSRRAKRDDQKDLETAEAQEVGGTKR